MLLPIPNLADKNYQELLEELIADIPKYQKQWTNYNPSDPGITILELLVWVSENILYRIDRVPYQAYVNLLKLVAGIPEVVKDKEEIAKEDRAYEELLKFLYEIEQGEKKSVAEIKAKVLHFLDAPYRAITETDFHILARESLPGQAGKRIKRTLVQADYEEGRVDVVIIGPTIDSSLCQTVESYLQKRVLLGTIVQVKEAEYTDVGIRVDVVCALHIDSSAVQNAVRKRLYEYLDPVQGGPQQEGWPYGRPLTIYELAPIVENTENVEYATTIRIYDPVARSSEDDGKLEKKIRGLVRVQEENIKVRVHR